MALRGAKYSAVYKIRGAMQPAAPKDAALVPVDTAQPVAGARDGLCS